MSDCVVISVAVIVGAFFVTACALFIDAHFRRQ